MKVMKFGGTSLGSGKRIKDVGQIVQQFHNQDKIIVVASAMSGITDKLITLLDISKLGNQAEVDMLLCSLRDTHFLALEDLSLQQENYEATYKDLNGLFDQLVYVLKEVNKYDYVISFGERLSACLLSAEIKNIGLKSESILSSEIIIVNNNSQHVDILMTETEQRARQILENLISQEVVPVVTGFFAATLSDEIVTLGRGGSDYSATILANVLDAEEVILWKDVDGVFDHDPEKDTQSVLYTELSYNQAILLAQNGAKVLHPECLKSVSAKEITVWVKNTFKPLSLGTRISSGNSL